MAMVIPSFIIDMTDPGEGPRGEGAAPTSYFQTILMPDGPKKIFGKRPSPLSQGLVYHFPPNPPPPPPPTSHLKLWIRHCIDNSRKY